MFTKRFTIVMLLVALFSLEGCVAPPPRQRVVYHEGGDTPDAPAGRYCHSCGTVRDIDQVELRQGNTGGGAVLGAIGGNAGLGAVAGAGAGLLGGLVYDNFKKDEQSAYQQGYYNGRASAH